MTRTERYIQTSLGRINTFKRCLIYLNVLNVDLKDITIIIVKKVIELKYLNVKM